MNRTLYIDFGSVSTREQLHQLLAEAFRFPGYYGRNWDAFDECIRDVELPPHVEIRGIEALRRCLPREAELIDRCITDFVRNVVIKAHSG
jgi:ribonuclease inhibitor